jgi:NADH-quinone oxidoreductase subunit H
MAWGASTQGMSGLDQFPVALKHWILTWTWWPDAFKPVLSALLSASAVIGVFALLFGIVTVIERKALGRIQNRRGPNRVGLPLTNVRLFGFGQFVADGIKMLTKEDLVPRAADRIVHFLAPILLVVPVVLAFAVLPFGRNMVALDLRETGLLFFFAVGAATELSVFMAGWSSRNKYSLLGAMRAIAQMISYELPLILSSLTVVMMVGSLSLVTIIGHQMWPEGGWVARWHVFTPWGIAGFLLFLIAAAAESNRTPFDLPEAESEIVAGYFTEYSGFKFALFFLGEYFGLFAICGLGITLFLGGWLPPFAFLDFIPSWIWFFLKLCVLVSLFIWTRGTIPRLRTDQLMNLAWKFMLPMAFINVVVAAVWHFTAQGAWNIALRWIVCAAMLVTSYLLLGRGFESKVGKREYRYAS